MGLKILYGILIALGIFIVITLIRAIFFVPKKRETKPLEKENVDVERVAKHLSGAIQIPTVSYPEKDKVDWSQFEKFHKFLEESYPLLHKTLEREDIAEASLLYRWKGKNPDLEPIALLSHQDVVPIEPGTEGDWTHEPFSGYNDGEFIWGRGALEMKHHHILKRDMNPREMSISASVTMRKSSLQRMPAQRLSWKPSSHAVFTSTAS